MRWRDIFKSKHGDDVYTKKYKDISIAAEDILGTQLNVKARDSDNNIVGSVTFIQDPNTDGIFYSEDTHVNELQQFKGIATAMYDFAEELGYTVVPSPGLTSDGEAFWAARKRKSQV